MTRAANTDANSNAAKPFRKIWQPIVTIIGGAIVFFVLYKNSVHGHKASRGELLGRWEHEGQDVKILLEFRNDGKFDRRPKGSDVYSGTWGTRIPESGEWLVNEAGVLVLVGGGSFHPYVDKDSLNLRAELDRNVVFSFKRRP